MTRHKHTWSREYRNGAGYVSRKCRGCGAEQAKVGVGGRWIIVAPGIAQS